MNRHRYRFNFRKERDLRWISHRDLLRLLERALRRAKLHLGMSQGFHPKPRFSFPFALALGLEGLAEWMEIELQDDLPADEVHERLQAELPDGLTLVDCQRIPLTAAKLCFNRVIYRTTIPAEDCPRVRDAIERFQQRLPLAADPPSAPPSADPPPIDVRHGLLDLWLHENQLTIEQPAGQTGGIGPRQVLAALGLPNLEKQGHVISRIAMLLSNDHVHESGARNAPPNIEQQMSGDKRLHETGNPH